MRRTSKFPLDYTLRIKSLKKSTVRPDGFYRNAFCQRRAEALNEHIRDFYFHAGYYETIDALNWAAEDLKHRAPRLWSATQQLGAAIAKDDFSSFIVFPPGPKTPEEILQFILDKNHQRSSENISPDEL